MPTVVDSLMQDLLARLPQWEVFDGSQNAGLFIGAVGFEERSPSCFELWCSRNSGLGCKALLVRYPSNQADNARQLERFCSAAEAAAVQMSYVDYARLSIYGSMCAALSSQCDDQEIVLDISTMASYAFYPTISAIFDTQPQAQLNICYAEALDYFPKQSEWTDFLRGVSGVDDPVQKARLFDGKHFQSAGVDHVFEPANFPGNNIDLLATHLVVVPKFFIRTRKSNGFLRGVALYM